MIRLGLELGWLYVQVAAEAAWEDRRVRFLVWFVATEIALGQMALGRLTPSDVLNDIVVGIAISFPFLR